jgi:hypothetical protein
MKTLEDALEGAEVLITGDELARGRYLRKTLPYWAKMAHRLMRRHKRYTAALSARHGIHVQSTFFLCNDLLQELLLALLEAVRTHDPARGPMAPHVLHVVLRNVSYRSLIAEGWRVRNLAVQLEYRTPRKDAEDNEDWAIPKQEGFTHSMARKMLAASETREEAVVATLLVAKGASEFDYERAQELLEWRTYNRRKSFERVARQCAARMQTTEEN